VNFRRLSLPSERFPAFKDDLLQRVRAIPGVQSAAITHVMPLRDWGGGSAWMDGTGERQVMNTNLSRIGPDYFKTLQIPLLAGRDIALMDTTEKPRIAIINQAAAAYFWVLPRALAVLLSFQQGVFDPLITADKYFAFAAQLIIAFGLVTELPLVIVILAALGLVTPQFLARNRRYAIVISAVASALLAPPDAISMVLMMVPLWLLY